MKYFPVRNHPLHVQPLTGRRSRRRIEGCERGECSDQHHIKTRDAVGRPGCVHGFVRRQPCVSSEHAADCPAWRPDRSGRRRSRAKDCRAANADPPGSVRGPASGLTRRLAAKAGYLSRPAHGRPFGSTRIAYGILDVGYHGFVRRPRAVAVRAMAHLQKAPRLWEHGSRPERKYDFGILGLFETADVVPRFFGRSPLPGRCRCGVPDIRFRISALSPVGECRTEVTAET